MSTSSSLLNQTQTLGVIIGSTVAFVQLFVYSIIKVISFYKGNKLEEDRLNELKALTTGMTTLSNKIVNSVDDIDDLKLSVEEVKKLTCVISTVMEKTWDMHNRYDENGSPIWYVPRDWQKTQKEIVDVCKDLSNALTIIARSLERIEDRQR